MSEHPDMIWVRSRFDELCALVTPNVATDFILECDPVARLMHCRFRAVAFDVDHPPDAETACLKHVCRALEIMASGHRTFIRTKPASKTETDFATNKRISQAFVRFSVSPDEGAWEYPFASEQIIYGSFGR